MSETQEYDTKPKTEDISLEDVLANKPPGKLYNIRGKFNVDRHSPLSNSCFPLSLLQ
jgi:hypothetical protein